MLLRTRCTTSTCRTPTREVIELEERCEKSIKNIKHYVLTNKTSKVDVDLGEEEEEKGVADASSGDSCVAQMVRSLIAGPLSDSRARNMTESGSFHIINGPVRDNHCKKLRLSIGGVLLTYPLGCSSREKRMCDGGLGLLLHLLVQIKRTLDHCIAYQSNERFIAIAPIIDPVNSKTVSLIVNYGFPVVCYANETMQSVRPDIIFESCDTPPFGGIIDDDDNEWSALNRCRSASSVEYYRLMVPSLSPVDTQSSINDSLHGFFYSLTSRFRSSSTSLQDCTQSSRYPSYAKGTDIERPDIDEFNMAFRGLVLHYEAIQTCAMSMCDIHRISVPPPPYIIEVDHQQSEVKCGLQTVVAFDNSDHNIHPDELRSRDLPTPEHFQGIYSQVIARSKGIRS
eukprot:GHVH01005355.1.p1 GENE.GHVH01005355.1~~GHVH01005355.1.p1  ORF type:complete len:397 (-),score=57.54 GHVH01005355.1:1787-2977(-)